MNGTDLFLFRVVRNETPPAVHRRRNTTSVYVFSPFTKKVGFSTAVVTCIGKKF
jgi:hypothetical protein